MFPGNVNPKKMKQMMKQMGMQVEPIEDVQQIVITTSRGRYIFDSAEVTAMVMQGMTTYQVVGQPRFEEAAPAIPEDDVKMVAEQSGVPMDKAREALVRCKGDIAEAILSVTQQ